MLKACTRRYLMAGLLAASALPSLTAPPRAQERTSSEPSDPERTLVMRYTDVLHGVLEQFSNDDWEEKIDSDVAEDFQVSHDANVPLGINEMMQRTFYVRPDSDLWKREFAPFVEKSQQSNDPVELAKESQKMKLNRLRVEVHFNRFKVGVDPAPEKNHDLQIPGAALSYRLEQSKFTKGIAVILLFGEWKSAKWIEADSAYQYQFKKVGNYPAIENIEMRIDGPEDRVNELLHSVLWGKVNEGLGAASN